MAEVKTEQEPSIEEILESIRQIISEDAATDAKAPPLEKPAAEKPVVSVVPPAPTPTPVPMAPIPMAAAPAPKQAPPAPLDLTEKVQTETVVALDLKPEAHPQPPVTIEMMDRPMTE